MCSENRIAFLKSLLALCQGMKIERYYMLHKRSVRQTEEHIFHLTDDMKNAVSLKLRMICNHYESLDYILQISLTNGFLQSEDTEQKILH